MRCLVNSLAGIVAGAGQHQRRGLLRLQVMHIGASAPSRPSSRPEWRARPAPPRRPLPSRPAPCRPWSGPAGLGRAAVAGDVDRDAAVPGRQVRHLDRSSRTGPSDWDAQKRSPGRCVPSARNTAVLQCARPCAPWSPSLFIERQISEDRPSDLFCQHVRSNFFEQAQERDGRLRATAQIAGATRGSPRRR